MQIAEESNVFIDGLWFSDVKLSPMMNLVFINMKSNSNFICKNLLIEDSELGVGRILSIVNELNWFELTDSRFVNSTVNSNAMLINTNNPKQIVM